MRGAGLDPQPRDFADHLAVPLRELERRHVLGELDRRIAGQHILQEPDPGLADAGLAVRQADEMRPDRLGQRAEHGLAVGQRNAADEMHNRMLAAVSHRGGPLFCGTADISATTSWRGSPPRSRPRRNPVKPSLRACKAVARATAIETSRKRRDRRQQIAAGVVARRRHRRQRLRRRHEHGVGEAARPHRDHAEADAREDVGVVGLVDLERPAVAHQRRKRAAGADHGAAVAPALDVGRRRLGARGRIGQREDHRPAVVLGHGPHDLLGERARLARHADQRRRLGVAHHIEQRHPAGLLERPRRDARAVLQERASGTR